MSPDNTESNVIQFEPGLREVKDSQANLDQRAGAQDAVCQYCFGTGTRIEPGKGASICDCRRSNSKNRLLAAAHIPSRYEHCTFDSYIDPKNGSSFESLCWARQTIEKRVKDYDPGRTDRGLLLMGSVGVGKTHLAVAMLKGLIARGVPSLFCESGSLLKQIQDSYNPISKNSELRVLAPIYQTEVLLLDELGSTVPTDWVRDTMYQIINKRYNDKMFTIFTTNYFDEAKVKGDREESATSRTFSTKDSSERIRGMTTLEDRIGTRLRSRLYEMCDTLTMKGEDFRPQTRR
jgi:DNA replication protein DnaC